MDVILDHYSHPRNYGRLDEAEIDIEGSNPGCGDVIRLQARIDSNLVISDVRFMGNGCTVSMASASLLTTLIEGLSLQEAVRIADNRMLEALETSLSPRRFDCALLGLHLIRKALVNYYHVQRIQPGKHTS